MIRVGEAVPGRDDFQLFRYEFNDVADDMTLDVVGGDDRVERPAPARSSTGRSSSAWKSNASIPNTWAGRRAGFPSPAGCGSPRARSSRCTPTSTKPLTEVRVQQLARCRRRVRSRAIRKRQLDQLRWDYGTLEGGRCADDPCHRHRRRHLPRAVSRFALRDSRRAAAGFRAARRDRHGDHARRDHSAGGQSVGRLWTRPHLVCLPGERRRRRASDRSSSSPAASRKQSTLDAFDTRGADAPAGDGRSSSKPGQTLFLSRAGDGSLRSDRSRRGSAPASSLRSTW